MSESTLPAAWGGAVPLPDPGAYRGVDMAEYHRWDAASNSRLGKLLKSPAHLKSYIEEDQADTPALRIGRAIHVAVLEPDDFAIRYVEGPAGDRRTKAVKDALLELGVTHPQAEILRPDEYAMCLAARDSVWRKKKAAALLRGEGDFELSITWEDIATGVRCKGRLDRLSPLMADGTIVDLKTTRDASPHEFERSLFKFGYHRQAAMYLMGTRRLNMPVRHYTIIAQEKTPPYACALYRMSDVVVSQVEDQVRKLLQKYADCVASDEWPDYPDEVRDISIPTWAWDEMDRQTEELEAA